MSKIQRLAKSLCPGCDGDPCGNCRDVAASILTDPAPLLAALAEAGALREESQCLCGKPDRSRAHTVMVAAVPREGHSIVRRYVTEWRPADE